MLHSAESRLRAMRVKINTLISARNVNKIKKHFRVFIRALGQSIYEKNVGRKSRETVSLSYTKQICYYGTSFNSRNLNPPYKLVRYVNC
jgi:hypothetical protein